MKEISLNGIWHVRSEEGQYEFDQSVPGSVFQSLEELGVYGEGDVFYRENNRLCLGLAERNFLFSRTFVAGADLLDSDRILLEADGLDTLTIISVNGREAGRTNNMHRPWLIDIKPFVREGENRIEILFLNSLEYIRKERERRTIFASDHNGVVSVQGFNMIRKSHCSFGWDWGPKIPDLGIWRDIRVRGYKDYRLEGIRVLQNHRDGRVDLELSPEAEVWGTAPVMGFTLTGPDGKSQTLDVACGEKGKLTVEAPRLWWPNGLGDQPLYTLTGTLPDGQKRTLRIGLRTLTVLREKDEWGETFAFSVNGIPFFSRGADYIPEDVYLTRVTREKTERLIQDAAAANFNSIRVWGGGVYPSEDFYDLCDIYGLVNWQDMMFACAIYDVKNRDFLENITVEVRENLKRIRHHASVGLICGNNEMEDGIMHWFPSTNEERMEYLKQYEFVFPAVAEEVCPELFYWPSSPSSGGSFEKPNAPELGDCHFWEVWHGLKPFSEYEKHYFRYMSEFGFESYPDMKTIESFTAEEDRNPFSRVMDDHQRCPGGNSKIFYYMSQYFKAPADLKGTVYLSQLSQADALTTGIRHWRRNRGRCMGAVYWQLNDNWPVASWASIDYYGRWKALHYEAKRAFDNLLVSCEGKESRVSLWLSNEDRRERRGKLLWQLTDFAGKEILKGEEGCVIAPFTSRSFITMDFSEELRTSSGSDRFLFVAFEEEGGEVYRASHAFAPYKHMNLEDPALTVRAEETASGIQLRVRAVKPALFVRLDLKGGDCVLSDNFFHMRGGEERILTPLRGEYTLREWQEKLEITSLFHSAY